MEPREGPLENILEEALRQYGAVEPRSGLEGRVLARLQAEPVQQRSGRWWWPAVALTTAALAIAMLRGAKPARGPVTETATNAGAATSGTTAGGDVRVSASPHRHTAARSRAFAPAKHDDSPKRDQFPSPVPLSEQEQMMARYVSEYRDRAVMVARAQTELLRAVQDRDGFDPRPVGDRTDLTEANR